MSGRGGRSGGATSGSNSIGGGGSSTGGGSGGGRGGRSSSSGSGGRGGRVGGREGGGAGRGGNSRRVFIDGQEAKAVVQRPQQQQQSADGSSDTNSRPAVAEGGRGGGRGSGDGAPVGGRGDRNSSGGRSDSGRGGSGGSSTRRERQRGGRGSATTGGGGGSGRQQKLAEKKKQELEAKQRKADEIADAATIKAANEIAEKEAARILVALTTEKERRMSLQAKYESTIQHAISVLETMTTACNMHSEMRAKLSPHALSDQQLSPLEATRAQFELTKKNLKSDLKKCTTFVKKIKSGQYPTAAELELPNSAIKTLNLTRYVEEVASAIIEPTNAPTAKGSKSSENMASLVMLCVHMHTRYPDFTDLLVPKLLLAVSGRGGGGSCGNNDNDDGGGGELGLPRKQCFRLLLEFVLHGITTDIKPIIKLIHDAVGIPTEEGKEYSVTNAHRVVTFAKVAGNEILGVIPRCVKQEMTRLVNEVEGKGDGTLQLIDLPPTTEAVAATTTTIIPQDTGSSVGKDATTIDDEKLLSTEDELASLLATPFTITLSAELRHKCQLTIGTFQSTIPNARAVPPNISTSLHQHTLGAYRSLSQSMASTHKRLLKLEKRCEQDRLLQGTLSDAREKGLVDARLLMVSLKKSVETLSDVLDVDAPILNDEEKEMETSDGKGIELWNRGSANGEENLGPFDDEETRSFYCTVPDLLSTKPPGLLGINLNEVEKLKERNLRVYGGNSVEEGGEIVMEDEGDMPIIEEELDLEEMEEDDEEEGDGKVDNDDVTDAQKDTPHYKLTHLLEQELPEASRRETIDELADRFCSNHGSNKNSRKRLYKTLFLVPRTRLDLLPYYSRFAAILDRVYLDSTLVTELEQQFHGQARFKKNTSLDGRLRTVRYLSELTKFRVSPPMVILRCLRRCLEDFTGHNIDVACCILESCGRYLFRMKHTHMKIEALMETITRIKKARNLSEREVSMITSALLMVNPPPRTARQEKVVPLLESYLRHLLVTRLEPERQSVSFVSHQIQCYPWSDPFMECGVLVTKYMLKACRRGRYKTTKAIAMLASDLSRSKPEVAARLIDAVLEEIEWFIRHPTFRDSQRTLVCARLLGELYCASVLPASVLFREVHHLLNHGHEIPEALRHASANQELFAPRGKVSQTIMEDEEMEDEEEEDTQLVDEENKAQQPMVVSVSPFSTYDPRVPSEIDPPTAVFRIKLVCTMLETASSHIVTPSNTSKLEFALASLQRYLFTKTLLPTDVEFSILDLFDTLDSELKKKVTSGRSRTKTEEAASSFVRYNCWFDAHQAVVAAEKEKKLDEARALIKLYLQAGLLQSDDADASVSDGASVSDVEISDEEDEGELSEKGIADVDEAESENGSVTESEIGGDGDDVSESSSDGEEELNEDEEEDDFDEEAAAAAEAAYFKQLQDEEFERELRKLTMDALEKGKVTSRATGGKVSSQMPAAPQFIAKKTGEQSQSVDSETAAMSPLVSGEGITFKLFKRGNKGKQEEVQLVVPKDTNLARRATKQDDAAAKERDLLKARVLQYEAESRESAYAGGNVYLDETKLQVIRNRPLTMETLNKTFGKSTDAPYKAVSEKESGRGPGRGFGPGRGPGRGFGSGRGQGRGAGRLFNPGRG